MTERTMPATLADYRPTGRLSSEGKYVLMALDSDGCVDLGMRYKHGGPFPRAGIEQFHLEPIAEAWRLAWSYVNEFQDRGCPRFSALAQVVDKVVEMPIVQEKEQMGIVKVPRLEHLKAYLQNVAKEKGYGDNVLNAYIGTLSDGPEYFELSRVADWSEKVNHYVDTDCPYIPPFAPAISAIQRANGINIDAMIVSGTPETHLRKTWEEHGLIDCITGVFGRESGKKEQHIVAAMKAAETNLGRMYDIAIMFGDAPGDDKERKKASDELGVRVGFMPIRVGYELDDWQWFLDNFLILGDVKNYTEDVEKERVEAFYKNIKTEWNPNVDLTRALRG